MFGNLINYFSLNEGRIEYFDIAKGIGIILVVWIHCYGPFTSQIHQFIMPMFFLISGLLYSQRSGVKEYTIRKFHSLYLPFVIWNLLFLLITAIFKNNIMFFLKNAILILLTLSKSGGFLGATWFLGSLFIIAVLYKILESSFKESNYKDFTLLFIFGIIAIIGFKFTFPYTISRTLILGFFYALGAFIKKYRSDISTKISKITINYLLPVFGGVIFIIISSFNSVSLGANRYTYPLLFVIGALGASYFIIYSCKLIESSKNSIISSIKKFLMVVGQHSIDILIWHIVFFKLIIIFQMIINNEKITFSNLMSYHNVFTSSNGWWIVYLLVGVFASLIWGYILRQGIWGKFLKKIYAVN